MEELDLFKKRLESLIIRAYEGGVCLLPFLDEAQMALIKEELKWHSEINAYFDGGIINSDRSRCVIAPNDYKVDFKIVVFKIIYNKKYYSISHRNILGSLMSLGIKREVLGDIVIDDDKNAYFACQTEMSDFLLQEFKYIGKAPIELEECKTKIENIIRYEEKMCFISSLRLDAVIAIAFSISRSVALNSIKNGIVFVNYLLVQNPIHRVLVNDIISVRHKGKIKIISIEGTTKSGRTCVKIGKRV